MKEALKAAAAALLWLGLTSSAMAAGRGPSCDEQCAEDLDTCRSACRKSAGAAADKCVGMCEKEKPECLKECENPPPRRSSQRRP